MAAGLGLSLGTSQHLALTPQLQQSIRMLQLSSLELALEVSTMLEQNPCLLSDDDDEEIDRVEVERLSDEFDSTQASVGQDSVDGESHADAPVEVEPTDWEGDGSIEIDTVNAEWADAGGDKAGSDGDPTRESSSGDPAPVSLVSHLLAQAAPLRLGDLDGALLFFLIHCLNDDGFLPESDEELAEMAMAQGVMQSLEAGHGDAADSAGSLASSVRVARCLIQQFEPVGLGAANVLDSLSVQARHLAKSATGEASQLWGLVLRLLDCPLGELARQDVKKLAKACQCDELIVSPALALLRTLDPHPGAQFFASQAGWVVPEVLVRRVGRSLKVEINQAAMPKLRVNAGFASALRGASRSAPMQQSLQEARWFIKNIRQRFDTILRVSEVIVERQRRFFMHGATAMKPLVLREIADELGVHESTVSRVTSSKFMQTPAGTFELKYFFGSSLSTAAGGITSATAVRALIGQMISNENVHDPMSDSDIAKALADQGISCARRTVAKYREALHIPIGALRARRF